MKLVASRSVRSRFRLVDEIVIRAPSDPKIGRETNPFPRPGLRALSGTNITLANAKHLVKRYF